MFNLDEEKAELAKNYAENLILFLEERDNESVAGNGTHKSIYDLVKDDSVIFGGGDFIAPIVNWRNHVSSEFGMRIHPITKQNKFHAGIEFLP